MLHLDKRRFQTSIAGKVIDAVKGAPMAGALVSLAGPPAFGVIVSAFATRYGDAWQAMETRPDRTRAGGDGFFQFGDLPDGNYTLTITASGGDAYYGVQTASATVSRDALGAIHAPLLVVALPPTAVKGKVMRSFVAPIKPPAAQPLARVRVRGTGQEAFTDMNGDYYLTGVDPGLHHLVFTSPELKPTVALVTINAGIVAVQATVTLNP